MLLRRKLPATLAAYCRLPGLPGSLVEHCCVSICAVLFLVFALPEGGRATEKAVGILLSREIAPYVTMVKGFESAFANQPVQRFFLDDQGRAYSLARSTTTFSPEYFSALVAVGPEALSYVLQRSDHVPVFYGMVLNPEPLFASVPAPPCGVTLNVPVEKQIQSLQRQLPGIKSLGILFDPANNQDWFQQASIVAGRMQLELVPLQVRRTAGRLELVGDFNHPDALMFIPDKSIISRTIIQYVIKQAVLLGIPVVGYNQFFLDSGAALAFVIDYEQVGRQVASQVESVLSGQSCLSVEPPSFELRRNLEVWQALHLTGGGGGS